MKIGNNPEPSSLRAGGPVGKANRNWQRRQAAAPKPTEAASVNVSASAKQLQRVEEMLRQESVPRPEAVARAKALLADWSPPTDAEVDAILARLFHDES